MTTHPPIATSAASIPATASDRVPVASATSRELGILRRIGDTLMELRASLCLSAERMARAEALERLELETQLSLESIQRLESRRLGQWFDALGDDLTLDLLSTGDVEDQRVTLEAGRAPIAAFEAFQRDVCALAEARGDHITVQARLSIGKTRAVAAATALLARRPDYLGTPDMQAHTNVVVYYHAAALRGFFRLSAVSDWERLGLARDDGRTCVVLCDASGYLAGPALEVVGARLAGEPRWLTLSRAAWRQFQTKASQTRHLRDDEGNWPGAPRVVTPAHLHVTARDAGLDTVAGWLASMRAEVAAAYLASSVHPAANNRLALRFAGARPCTCAIAATPPSIASETSPSGELARLATWAYDHASPDKLAIVRECLARELPPGGVVSLAQLERLAPAVLESAKANFALYLRARTAEYFQLREKAEEAVTEYARTVRKAVADLTSEVVGNVFGTVGLLVGVVIAGLIQPSVSLAMQRLATLLYTGYVAFLLLYLMRARWQRYILESADVTRRLSDMPELSATQRLHLQQQATLANRHFEEYFHLSRAIYLALAVLGLLYFVLLLTPLASHIALPHPVLTPTLTPTLTPKGS